MRLNTCRSLSGIVLLIALAMEAIFQALAAETNCPLQTTIESSAFAGIYDSARAVSVFLKAKNNGQHGLDSVFNWELRRLPSMETLRQGRVAITAPPGQTVQTELPFPKNADYGLYEFTATAVAGKERITLEPARAAIMREPPKDREMDNLGFNIHVVNEEPAMLLRRLGVRWARIDFNWNFTTSRDGIPWDYFDKQVKTGEKYGLKLLPNFCYVPKWARKADGLFDPKDHADYISKLLTRYKGKFPAFCVWNEPDDTFNKVWPDDLKAIREAVEAADPHCKITGLAQAANPGNPGGYFKLLQPPYSIGTYLDAYDWHNYPAPRNRRPEASSKVDSVEDLETTVRQIRPLIAGKEVWLSEHGYTTCDPKYDDAAIGPFAVTERQQGDYLVRQLLLEYGYGIDRVFIYQLGADGTAGDPESQWGITRSRANGLSAKVAYVQVGNMVQELAGAVPIEVAKPLPDFRVARFRRGPTNVVAVWKIVGTGQLTFHISDGYLSDAFGNRTPENGTVRVDVSESPVFLVGKTVDDQK
ncbi:MAG: hypothetical protein M1608_14070 [Candidatus Omnitrophica bacterium]|nr:hypothetical protein [Candidatus Omnitrophota bacterium]